MKRLLIFDFDGVLADSFQSLYRLVSRSFTAIGLSLTPDVYRALFVGNVHSGFRALIQDEAAYKRFLAYRHAHFAAAYALVKLFPGATDFVKKASEKYKLAVASSGQPAMITQLLACNGITSRFAAVLATPAHSKIAMLQTIIGAQDTTPAETTFITDTSGDIAVGRSLGCRVIAVGWGFHTPQTLAAARPTAIVNDFAHLANCLRLN